MPTLESPDVKSAIGVFAVIIALPLTIVFYTYMNVKEAKPCTRIQEKYTSQRSTTITYRGLTVDDAACFDKRGY